MTQETEGVPGIPFGHRIVRLKTTWAGKEKVYMIHEDMLCQSSGHFRRQLQNKRKRVEHECSICSDALQDDDSVNINFCSECGQNFHRECCNKWRATRGGNATCPMCRARWGEEEMVHEVPLAWQPWGVDLYFRWLYGGEPSPPVTDSDTLITKARKWSELYELAVFAEDEAFKKKALRGFAKVLQHISIGEGEAIYYFIRFGLRHSFGELEPILLDFFISKLTDGEKFVVNKGDDENRLLLGNTLTQRAVELIHGSETIQTKLAKHLN